ncbi:MAG: hypothetical protein KAJ62_07095 [Desulfobacteraceae bacterium]|nr:hypothetical protein [Desulfobacteraceae bacterium]
MNKFNVKFYFSTLNRLLKEPGKFFKELPEDTGIKFPLSFLLVSCVISTIVGLTLQWPGSSPVLIGGIYFFNALGMVFVAAFFTFLIMAMFMKNKVTFTRCFAVYAFATGLTVLVAGIPLFIWLTEPWKWWLIGTGMINNFKYRTIHVVLLLIATIIVILLFFWSVLPALKCL